MGLNQTFYYFLHNSQSKKTKQNRRNNTGCPRRNVQYFGRVFLMLNCTDITQNTSIQS